MSSRVSVAMAVFNGSAFIEEQLSSILVQTRPVDEIVVSDGGSSDNSLNVAHEFLRRASYSGDLKLLTHDRRLYPHNNFEAAVAATTGDIIFLCDQDDVWYPGKVQTFLAYFAKGWHVCISDFDVCDANMKPVYGFLSRYPKAKSDRRSHMHGCASAMSKEFKQVFLPFGDLEKDKIWFDQWLSQLSEGAGVRCMIPDRLHGWRRHEEAWSGPADTGPATDRQERRLPWGSVADQVSNIKWQLAANRRVAERLSQGASSEDLNARLHALNAESRFLEARQRYLIDPWRRLFTVPAQYMLGRYRRFGGVRSAAIDMIRF